MYVVIGNKGRVALFKKENKKDSYRLSKKFKNDSVIDKESNIYAHRAGTGATTYTSNQTTLGESHYKEEVVSRFCKDIVEYLEKTTKDKKNDSVLVIGGPSFVGEFRKKSSKKLNQLITKEISKNFYTEKSFELETFLKKHSLD